MGMTPSCLVGAANTYNTLFYRVSPPSAALIVAVRKINTCVYELQQRELRIYGFLQESY